MLILNIMELMKWHFITNQDISYKRLGGKNGRLIINILKKQNKPLKTCIN